MEKGEEGKGLVKLDFAPAESEEGETGGEREREALFRVSRKSAATEAVLRPFFKKRRRLPCLPWDYGRGKDWKRRRPRQGKNEGTSYFGLIPRLYQHWRRLVHV